MHPMPKDLPHTTSYTYMIWTRSHLGNTPNLREVSPIGLPETFSKPKLSNLLVVEPNYLPDSEVFYFQPCLYPMKYLHTRSMYTLPRGGVQRGGTPFARFEGAIPPVGGSGGKWAPSGGLRAKPLKKKLPCKSIL